MKKSFIKLPKPIVTCIVAEKTIGKDIGLMKNGEYDGAVAFAVHMEPLGRINSDDMKRLIEAVNRPVMLLRYRGNWDSGVQMNEEERIDMLRTAALSGAAAIDLTADTFDPTPGEFSTKTDAVARQQKVIDEFHKIGTEVIMSSHIQEYRSCVQVIEQMKQIEKRGVDFAKIVTVANTQEEFLEAVNTTMTLHREMKIPFIHLVSGKYGRIHRFLSPMLGNCMTFCVQRYSEDFYGSPQPPLANMLTVLKNINWIID